MKQKFGALTLLLAFSLVVQAHEFWMQPNKFRIKVGESISVSFKVGENFIGQPWPVKKARIEKLQLHNGNNVKDMNALLQEGEKDNLKITASEEGTHLVVMESNNAFIASDGKSFTEYLEEDGLDEVLSYREKMKMMDDSAKEFYSRHTKLLFQVGEKTDDTFRKEVGLPVEIVPQRNPYNLKVGDPVHFKILHNGKPLFGAKVKVWNRYNNRTTTQNIYSQQDGMIETRISNPGLWMVSVVNMVPLKDSKAEWQSYWASLVFGIQ